MSEVDMQAAPPEIDRRYRQPEVQLKNPTAMIAASEELIRNTKHLTDDRVFSLHDSIIKISHESR